MLIVPIQTLDLSNDSWHTYMIVLYFAMHCGNIARNHINALIACTSKKNTTIPNSWRRCSTRQKFLQILNKNQPQIVVPMNSQCIQIAIGELMK